jgi:hypothetical protein
VSGDYVYAIWAGNGPIKVGKATSVKARLQGIQTGSHKRLAVLKEWHRPDGDAAIVERLAHGILADYRQAGEWFRVSPEKVCAAVERAIITAETPPPPPAPDPEEDPLSPEARADLEWAKANPGQLAREIIKWHKEANK